MHIMSSFPFLPVHPDPTGANNESAAPPARRATTRPFPRSAPIAPRKPSGAPGPPTPSPVPQPWITLFAARERRPVLLGAACAKL